MTLIVCLSGPESTGKTTLAEMLAQQLPAFLVPEYARTCLERQRGDYQESDLLAIAKEQWRQEQLAVAAHPCVVLDTDLANIEIWSELRFDRCHPWIFKRSRQVRNKLYLLMMDDIPWVEDPLRHVPDRKHLMATWTGFLAASGARYKTVQGTGRSRFNCAYALIQQAKSRQSLHPEALP